MIRDLEVADLLQNLYDSTAEKPTAESQFDAIRVKHGIVWAEKTVDDALHVFFRGSVWVDNQHVRPDWLLDSAAIPIPYEGLGVVHAGFIVGMSEVLDAISATNSPIVNLASPVSFHGHSLGAARAANAAALAQLRGWNVAGLTMFGEPKSSIGSDQRQLLVHIPGAISYVNTEEHHRDTVTLLPTWPFDQPIALTPLAAKADPDDPDVAFRLHHMPVYRAALAARTASASA